MEKVFDRLQDCCGCALCAEKCPVGAIHMEMDEFSYPSIDREICVDCGLCREICVIQHRSVDTSDAKQAFAAVAKDDTVRLNSSSGGAFTVLSDGILAQDGAVCGAAFDEQMRVCHQIAFTNEARDAMRGSKYVQSDMRKVYADLRACLESGKRVLFVGTPCSVAAVKRCFEMYEERLFTVDIICHGVPSPDVWQRYISYIQQKYGKKVVGYTFRDKLNGWHRYHSIVTFEDGTTAQDTDAVNAFEELFRYDLCLRPSCTSCPYTTVAREGDITLGDFWGVDHIYPELDDDKGVSAVLINTEKGETLLPLLQQGMTMRSCTVQDIATYQQNMQKPSTASVKADAFRRDLHNLPFECVLKKYTRVGARRRLIDAIKRVLPK